MEHTRAAEPTALPVRTPQQELRHRRLLEELEPVTENVFAAAAREYLAAIASGRNRIRNTGQGGER
ncbi:hypothetical protein [Streptomyces sp. NPDC090445]|uniref:hypothetical protein n=1 Tax=Streptomyces sp. NPDC090445 TaxID=3365963 RepID=UPI0038279CD3